MNRGTPMSNSEARKKAGEQAPALDIEYLLERHEARWTTYGFDRTYDVMHCAGECDWSLRQKVSMSDDECHAAHRAHVAAVIREQVEARNA